MATPTAEATVVTAAPAVVGVEGTGAHQNRPLTSATPRSGTHPRSRTAGGRAWREPGRAGGHPCKLVDTRGQRTRGAIGGRDESGVGLPARGARARRLQDEEYCRSKAPQRTGGRGSRPEPVQVVDKRRTC